MSAGHKWKFVQSALKKARNEQKSKDNYRTVKKAGGAKDVTKGGANKGGTVKVVDKRLKSDKRGEKRSIKRKGKMSGKKSHSSKRGKKQNANKSGRTSKKSVKKRR